MIESSLEMEGSISTLLIRSLPCGRPEKPVDCKREFADRDCVAGNTDACGLEHYVISRDFVFKYTKDKITEKKSRKVLLQMAE